MTTISELGVNNVDFIFRDAAAKHLGEHIAVQPVSVVGKLGDYVSFTTFAKGDDITYQWYISRNNGSTWTTLGSGYRNKTLTFDITENRDGFQYKCLVSSASGGWTEYTDAVKVCIDETVKDSGRIKTWQSVGSIIKDGTQDNTSKLQVDLTGFTELAIRAHVEGTADSHLQMTVGTSKLNLISTLCTSGSRYMLALFEDTDFGIANTVCKYGSTTSLGSAGAAYMHPFADPVTKISNIVSFNFKTVSAITSCKVDFFAR